MAPKRVDSVLPVLASNLLIWTQTENSWLLGSILTLTSVLLALTGLAVVESAMHI